MAFVHDFDKDWGMLANSEPQTLFIILFFYILLMHIVEILFSKFLILIIDII